MSGALLRMIRRFRRDERGVVLILVVLLVVPLMLLIAVGIDFGQSLIVKRQLTGAVDAAALAIGADPDLIDQVDLDAKAEAYIQAHYPDADFGDLTNFVVTRTELNDSDTLINVTATAEIPTFFMRLGGVDSLTVRVSSQVFHKQNQLEIVMVLDNSGSMNDSAENGQGTKLQAMKTAANTLVDILFGDDEISEKVKIGLVPFAGGVNINVPSSTWWLDQTNPAPLNTQYLNVNTGAGQSAFSVLATMRNNGIADNWRGCVRSRYNAGIDNLDTTDAPPNASDAETLFSAYFKAFAWSNPSSPASYALLGPTAFTPVFFSDNNQNCPHSRLQTLTNQKSTITSAINAMEAAGSTNIPNGLVWGWRVISPGEPFTQGAPYDDDSTIKAIIVLSDGDNRVEGHHNFSSYGSGGNSNPQIGPSVNNELDDRTEIVCENIKGDHDGNASDQDILLFSIVFDVHSGTILNLMEGCASDSDKFFNSPSTSELQSVFEIIAASLNQLRIAQ